MSGSEWAWIIAASGWALLMLALSILVVVKIGRLVTKVGNDIDRITDETLPLIAGLSETVSGLNVELARVDTIVAGVQHITVTADSLVGVIHATLTNPLIKAAAYMTGARAAIKSARKLKDA